MHEIQRHILKKIATDGKSKFSTLKPNFIESNQFVYHLKSLIREDYITRKNIWYQFTAKGKFFIDRVSFETIKERIQPKIVTILVIRQKNKYLFYKRLRSPFKNFIGFPYGKIHLEERINEAALRELQEKTGLQTKLTHKGEIYITVHDETELISHMLCHIFVGNSPKGELKKENSMGQCFWSKLEEIPKNRLIPGVKEIIKLLKNKKDHFFAEYFLNTSEND